jgi:hypothetical protein
MAGAVGFLYTVYKHPKLFGHWMKVFALFVLMAVLRYIWDRDFYLYFLDKAVFPGEVLNLKVPTETNSEISVEAKPGDRVVYWAAKAGSSAAISPQAAYGNYANSGVTEADVRGKAVLKFMKPQPYTVPGGVSVSPHVHYRVYDRSGIMSRVHTVTVA